MFRNKNNSTLTTASQIPLVPYHHRSPSDASYRKTSTPGRDGLVQDPPGWPAEPQPLTRSIFDSVIEGAVDLVIVVLSFVFLIFGFTVLRYDQAPVAEHQELARDLVAATKYGPTLFPILFAAVVGRAVKGILMWRLERGEKLGTLDLLAGSYTLVSTITAQLTIGVLSFTGPGLILLWAFSPIGGQASLRVMTIGNATTNATVELDYMLQQRSFVPFVTADDASQIAIVDGLFVAALLSPWKQKLSSTDPWENVKIPMIETLEQSTLPDNDGWYDTDPGETVFASLIGIPISNTTYPSLNTTLTMETSYWHLDCPVLTRGWQPPNVNTSKLPWEVGIGMSGELASNGSTSPLCGFKPNPGEKTDVPPRTIVYNNWDNDSEYSQSGSICTITTTYVEAEVNCIGPTCATSRIRRSTLANPTSAWTMLDSQDCRTFGYFANMFANLIDGHSATATGAVIFFVDPRDPFNSQYTQPLYKLDKQTYSIRLTQLMNTVWSSIAGMYAIPGGLNVDTSTNNITYFNSATNQAFTKSTTAIRSTNTEVIQCHRSWLAVLAIASFAMVIASLTHPVVRYLRKGPDFSLNVSTMTRDNPWLAVPSTASHLDSSKRARLLRDYRVRFGDVQSDNDVGHLAVSSLGNGCVVTKARKRRPYD